MGEGFTGEVGIVMTFDFLFVIVGATDKQAPRGFAPIVGAIPGGFVCRPIDTAG